MNNMELIAELEAKESALRSKRLELEEAQRDSVSRPILRKLVGKCFKYDNGYNTGERWWLYCRVVRFNEKDMTYTTVNFQHTTRRRIEVEYEHVYNYNGRSRIGVESGWNAISTREYVRARRKALKFLYRLLVES